MTLRYAKIASLTVADEYFAVTDKVEALYGQAPVLPADAIGPKMARLRREHHRMLGNGYCTRPPELDCAFESICETCTFFHTSIEFRPTLATQHQDAAAKNQPIASSCSHHCSPGSTRTPHESSAPTQQPPQRTAATRTSHDQLDNDHRHNADDRAGSLASEAPGMLAAASCWHRGDTNGRELPAGDRLRRPRAARTLLGGRIAIRA
jgi:hypothetical protein